MKSIFSFTLYIILCCHSTMADVFVGDSISVSGTVSGITAGFWGTTAPAGVLANGSPHVVGTSTIYGDSLFGPSFTVAVTSTAAADGLSGSVTIDFSNYAPQDFTSHFATIILKDDHSITTAALLQGPGTLSVIAGNSISYTASGVALFFDPVVTIAWTQAVPAPGAAALLAAALARPRRRR